MLVRNKKWVLLIIMLSVTARQATAFAGLVASRSIGTSSSRLTPQPLAANNNGHHASNDKNTKLKRWTIRVSSDADEYLGRCTCGSTHVSPRVARVMMPMMSMLASPFGLPKEAQATSIGSFEDSASLYFPGSQSSARILSRVVKTLHNKRHYTPSNTLFGTSICPDEINSKPTKSLSTKLQQSMSGKDRNGAFNLGGLGGLPFVGQAGMRAFLSHCPQDGKVLIFFGPHVGITAQGMVGLVERQGQVSPGAACGAVVGAYKEVLREAAANNKKEDASDFSVMDFQEEYLISRLRSKVPEIRKILEDGGEDMVAAFVTEQVYLMVQDMIMTELETSWNRDTGRFWDGITEVSLLGGVVINGGTEDYFQPITFESWSKPLKEGGRPAREDLFFDTFGTESPSRQGDLSTTTGRKNGAVVTRW